MRLRLRRGRYAVRIFECLPQLPGLLVPGLVPGDFEESIQVGDGGCRVSEGILDRGPVEIGSGQMRIEGDATVEILQGPLVVASAISAWRRG